MSIELLAVIGDVEVERRRAIGELNALRQQSGEDADALRERIDYLERHLTHAQQRLAVGDDMIDRALSTLPEGKVTRAEMKAALVEAIERPSRPSAVADDDPSLRENQSWPPSPTTSART